MPLSDLLILLVIALAFSAFAVVLAWGDYQTSRARRTDRQPIDQRRKIAV